MTSPYFMDFFDKSPKQRKNFLDRICKKVEILRQRLDFKTIVVCGVSGLLIGPYVSYQLGLELVVIRKFLSKKDHATTKVECGLIDKFLIIDDLIHSGNTIHQILCEINKDCFLADLDCVGIYLYNDDPRYGEKVFSHKNRNIPIFYYP